MEERLFDHSAKEVLRKQIWVVAEFCGMQIVTYAILSNHFHVLVRVPKKTEIADVELLQTISAGCIRARPAYQATRLKVMAEVQLAGQRSRMPRNGGSRMSALMGDISPFMKLLKQRFSIWFNKSHEQHGTLWSERFKSVLVEGAGSVLQTMAAYIDLTCVRAGLAEDPKDYRFCGYAEAVAGHEGAREGLGSVCGGKLWAGTQAAYRQLLFGTGVGPREKDGGISIEAFNRVMAEGGKLPLADALRCRIRYFSDGAVLGGRAFVETQLVAHRAKTGRRRRTGPRALPPIADWGELTVLRKVREPALG